MSERKILTAFLLNLLFSVIEFVGGILTGSIAIISDAVHDVGDSVSIGLSYILEKVSKRPSDETHTYGYLRYSVLGSLITTLILSVGSVFVIVKAVDRLFNPVEIDYSGMIWLAVIGAVINLAASIFTKDGDSLNQKAVSLHMLEDVLGWVVVLIGAIIMHFTDFYYIDSVMSIGVAVFIFYHAIKNLKLVLDIFLEKMPEGIEYEEIKKHLLNIDGVSDVHHLHIRSIDGVNNVATVHIVTSGDRAGIKSEIKNELKEHGIVHATVEIEHIGESCDDTECNCFSNNHSGHHHHGHGAHGHHSHGHHH